MPESDSVMIDPARCKGHGVCVAVCPAFVYEQKEPKAVPAVARPMACIRCGQCVAACPEAAIKVHGVRVSPFPDGGTTPPVTSEALAALLRRRRSVRRMTEAPVPEPLLKQIIEAASTAPTAKNSRAVRITVVQDAALLKSLVARCLEVYRGLLKTMTAVNRLGMLRILLPKRARIDARVVESFRAVVQRLEAGEDPILFNAPAVVVFSAPIQWGMSPYDSSYAMMNAILMAETLGLGTCIMGYFFEAARRDAQMRKMLQLPDHEQVFGAMTVGFPRYPMRQQIDRRRFRTNWM